MAELGTWEVEQYGPLHGQTLHRNTDAVGTGLPWLLYFAGGGWQRVDALSFTDGTVGEPMWRSAIQPNLGSYPVVCFVAQYMLRRQDFASSGDNDLTNQVLGKYASTPAFRGAGIRAGQRAVQYIKANAERFGIDPNAGCVMGASSGGQVAAGVAYSPSASYGPRYTPGGGQHRYSSRVGFAHLRITPVRFEYYLDPSIHASALFGVQGATAWTNLNVHEKRAVSAVDIGNDHGLLVPTFYYSDDGSLSATAAQDPPWSDATDAYSAGTTYAIGDRVLSSGKNYYSLQNGNLGNTPASSPSFWEEYSGTPYHHPINGKILKEECFDRWGHEYVFGHDASGHTYPGDIYAWMQIQWNRLLSA